MLVVRHTEFHWIPSPIYTFYITQYCIVNCMFYRAGILDLTGFLFFFKEFLFCGFCIMVWNGALNFGAFDSTGGKQASGTFNYLLMNSPYTGFYNPCANDDNYLKNGTSTRSLNTCYSFPVDQVKSGR